MPDTAATTHPRNIPASQVEHGALRILMIAPTSFFADYGCHVRILEEARILEELGHRVTVCTYYTGRDVPGLDIRRTASIPWRRDYEVGSSRHKVAFDLLLVGRALAAMWQVRPHVIHAHLHEGALIGYLLARLWGVPLVFDFQGSMTSEMLDHHFLSRNGRYYKPLRKLEQAIDQIVPHILTSSVHAKNLLTDEFACTPQKITCLPDCVDTEKFKPWPRDDEWVRFRQAWGVPPGCTVVVYLGKLAEYQGIDHLLRAAQKLLSHRGDVHFVIAGYPFVDHYRVLATQLGIAEHVTFTGRVRYEDAPHILSLGDIAISPKLSQTEGAGKLLNYMAMALPTVAFDTAVGREYMREYGVYATCGDSEDLAQCLEGLVDDPPRRAALGNALRQRAQEQYSWYHAGQVILDVYTSLMH
jgi:glycosyltransferase involved in cell wall biosynthesis